MTRGLFVTGTDTGVGKTRVACALLASLVAAQVRAVGMKPVASGVARGASCNEDVAALAAADGLAVPLRDRNPYAFVPPIAPHVAAREAGVAIELPAIARAFGSLAQWADVIVVEGAGGARVPLGPGLDMLDLPRRLRLPVLLVVGMRLGCLNHALLTADAIGARGLTVAGWIANRVDPHMERADESVAALADRLPAPLVADVGFGAIPAFTRRDCERLGLLPRAQMPQRA